MSNVNTVAIVGAGAAGLTSIKCCLDEGLRPTCFERTTEAGGVWVYAGDDRRDGRICVSATTTTNTSKEMMAFSDFPMPKHLPNYMLHSNVLAYLHSYADTFDLEKYITYGREVTLVKPTADFDSTGRWTVAVRDCKTGEAKTTIFDAVIICNGRNAQPNLPNIPGLGSFRGPVIHAVEHTDGRAYEGKKVVVIGMGNSGCDVAVDASRIASKVFLATRQGVWVMNKSNDLGLPIDTSLYRRSNGIFGHRVGPQFDHTIYGLDPKWRYLDGPTVTSNELQSAVLCGYVTLKAGVTSVTENSVVFADGTQEEDIDIIVCATGYNYSFPPLKDSVCLSHDNTFQLYRWTFPPSLKPATLAVVGVTPPLGPVFPELEIQSRWAARVFKGLCRLPDSSTMWREVTGRRQDQVEYVTYMDTVATEIGCKPNIAKLLLTDPKLGFHCYFGPATAFQYRLMGPGRWDGAREAVLGSQDRMLYPLKTRYRTEKMDADGERRYGVVALMAVVPLVALVAAVSQWYSAIAVRSL